MSDAVSANESAKSALESTTKELEEQNKKIADLQSKGTLTYVEQEELDKLKETTKQLQLQEDIEERKSKKTAKDQADKTVEAYQKQYGKNEKSKSSVQEKLDYNKLNGTQPMPSSKNDVVGNIAALVYYTEQLNDTQERYNNALKNGEDIKYYSDNLQLCTDTVTDYENTLDETVTDLLEKQQNLQDGYDSAIAKKEKGEALSTSEKETISTYEDILSLIKLIYEYTNQSGWNDIQFNGILDTNDIEKSKDELQEMAKEGSLTEEELKKYPKLYEAIKNADFLGDDIDNVKEFISQIKASTDAVDDLDNATSNSFTIPDSDTLQQQLSDLNSAIDDIQSAYDTLNSAVEEYNTNGGQLSIDTIQSLMSLSDEYLSCLQVENGQLSLNTDMMAQLAQAKLDEAQATAVTQAMTELDTIAKVENVSANADYISGNATLMESLAQLSGSYDGVAQAAMTAAQAQALSAQIDAASNKDKTATENVMKGLNAKLKLIQATKSTISAGNFGSVAKKTSAKSSGSKSDSKSSTDATKEAFQAEYNLLKHNLEMEYITEEQYYNSVQDLNNKYFAGKSEYLDEYRQYEEEVYKGLKSYYKSYCDDMMNYYEKALDANRISFNMYSSAVKNMLEYMWKSGKISAQDYWSYVETMLNKQKDIYDSALSAITDRIQEEIDSLQDEIDALEDKNDTLNKQKDDYDKILSAVDKVYQDEIDKLNEQKDLLQDKIDAINDATDALDLQYRKEQALYG